MSRDEEAKGVIWSVNDLWHATEKKIFLSLCFSFFSLRAAQMFAFVTNRETVAFISFIFYSRVSTGDN